ncbi:cytochrome P450 [archaeon]|nr:MAG: cytochrome P450 [archaeon]
MLGEYKPILDGATPDLPSISLEKMQKLLLVRMCLAESLRMYPQPPLLIRRALTDHTIKYRKATVKKSVSNKNDNSDEGELRIQRGTDIFLSIYNIHRSARFYDQPDRFIPRRWLQNYTAPIKLQSRGSDDQTG